MDSLAKLAIDAHGGLDRWRQFETLSAHLSQGGALWGIKGQAGTLDDTNVTVGLRQEWASHSPFGGTDRRTRFEAGRVALEAADGAVLEELLAPRRSFAGHTLQTPWTDLQLAYFAGCAMWTYLNTPFLLAWPGVESAELSPWQEAGETWRRLEARFPETIATHSAKQTFYFDTAGLLKRHDYDVEIAGGSPGAHYIDAYTEASGITVPSAHRIFVRQDNVGFRQGSVIVSIDVSKLRLA